MQANRNLSVVGHKDARKSSSSVGLTSIRRTRNFRKPSRFAYSSASDVGIPGFDRLFNPKYGRFGKAIWALAITVTCLACIQQVASRIKTFLDYSVSVDVKVETIATISFPAATVCPYQPLIYNKEINELRKKYARYTNTTYQPIKQDRTASWKDQPAIHHFDLLKLENISVDTLWKKASVTRDHIANTTYVLCEHYTKINCHLELEYEETLSYMGTCLTIRLSGNVQYDGNHNGYEVDIKDYVNEVEYWYFTLQLHNSEFTPTHSMLYTDVGQLFHPNYETGVAFHVAEFQRANSPHRPCSEIDKSRNCKHSCVEKHIAAKVSCRLPYLNLPKLPSCRLPEEAKHTHNVTFEVYGLMDELCKHCYRACNEKYYTLVQDVVKTLDNFTRFKVQMAENSVEYIREFIPYSLAALVSDIGGSLGFFLGICSLTGLQMVEVICAIVFRTAQKFKGKQY